MGHTDLCTWPHFSSLNNHEFILLLFYYFLSRASAVNKTCARVIEGTTEDIENTGKEQDWKDEHVKTLSGHKIGSQKYC